MDSSVENSIEEEEVEEKPIIVSFGANLALKSSILLEIQKEVCSNDVEKLKLKFRSILDDLKCFLLQKKCWKLLYSTILRQLNSSERRKSRLWDALISGLK